MRNLAGGDKRKRGRPPKVQANAMTQALRSSPAAHSLVVERGESLSGNEQSQKVPNIISNVVIEPPLNASTGNTNATITRSRTTHASSSEQEPSNGVQFNDNVIFERGRGAARSGHGDSSRDHGSDRGLITPGLRLVESYPSGSIAGNVDNNLDIDEQRRRAASDKSNILGGGPADMVEKVGEMRANEYISNQPANEVALRKRKLEIEMESSRIKLRLLDAERESVELALASAGAPGAHGVGETSSYAADNISSTVAHALTNALREFRSSTPNDRQPSLINRLAIEKQDLSFSGNTMEWLRFKRAFDQSSALGNYSDQENAYRLFKCLKGDARSAMESLMITSNSGIEIMNALERRYGNAGEVVLKLVGAIRNLPRLNSDKMHIVEFASVLKNNVKAMLSIGNPGYLNNIELIREVFNKLPQPMLLKYNDFVASSANPSNLETLANFLDHEADLANRAGTAHVFGGLNRSVNKPTEKRNAPKRVYQINEASTANSPKRSGCYRCSSEEHRIGSCKEFIGLSLNERWGWVKDKSNPRGFKCLGS